MNPKISIVIPFYNVEKYIEKCINSVKNQTFTDFECLLIDDESPDNSFEIAQKTIGNDSRFRIIRQKNTRQGGARNNGISQAKGDFLTFLDSDDQWEENYLEIMYKTAIQSQSDIVCCTYKRKNSDNQITGYSIQYATKKFSHKQLIFLFLQEPTPCCRLYKKELWQNIRFPENVFMEDWGTTFQTALLTDKITFINDSLYIYNINENSTTNTFRENFFEEREFMFNYIKKNLTKWGGVNLNLKEILTPIYLFHVCCLNFSYALNFAPNNQKEIVKTLKKKLNKTYFNPISFLRSMKYIKKFRIIAFLWAYYFSTSLVYFLFKMIKKQKSLPD